MTILYRFNDFEIYEKCAYGGLLQRPSLAMDGNWQDIIQDRAMSTKTGKSPNRQPLLKEQMQTHTNRKTGIIGTGIRNARIDLFVVHGRR